MARSVQEDADEKRAGTEAAGTGLSFPPLPARARVVAAERRTRGCGARASVSAAGRASGAGRGAEGSRGGGSGGDCRACAPGSSRGGRGRLLPPARSLARPPRAAAPSPSAPRGFLQTSARVSWGRGPLGRSAGELFLVPFPSSPPPAGRCLFLETLPFDRSGSPGIRSNSRPPSSELPPPRPPAPGRLARGRPRSPLAAWRSQLAPGRQARPGPGVGGGPAPARKLESFVLAPRPGRQGEEGRERRLRRGGLGRAGAWPWPRSGIRVSSGSPVRASSLGFLRRADLVLPSPFTALRASPATLAYPLVVVTWGAEGNDQPVELGLGLTLYSGPIRGRASVFSWVTWGQEETRPRRVLVNSGS